MLKKALLFILVSTFACAANAEELKNKFFNSPLFTTDSNDVVIGDAKAKVIIVEYSSLNCPHCAQFHLGPLKEIKKDYIDTGKVKYVLRDFPLNAPALAAAKLAHCAGPSRYYDFVNTLFDAQKVWGFHPGYLASLQSIARLGGISDEQFTACQNNKVMEEMILKRAMDASNQLEVESTPTLFVNGEKMTGALPYKAYQRSIEDALNRK